MTKEISPIDQAEIASVPVPAPGNWCIRSSKHEVIARWIPDGTTVVACRILVLGDVGGGATLYAEGGSARIDVMGSVHAGARIGAAGGGAHILIQGEVFAGTLVYARGGSSRIEFLSSVSADTGAEGGASEVLYLGK